MTQLAPGDVLADRYQIHGTVGEGGMQHVYACYDRSLSRQCVLKVPKAGVHDRRFRRGAAAGALVRHQNVAATFDYYEDQSFTFMVEELVPGRDLAHRLQHDFYYLDPALAAHLIHHIARGVLAAHRAGICHRDLKPNNIMVSDDAGMSVVKLTDFGIAKMAQAELGAEIDNIGRQNSMVTSSSTLLGAMPYLSPECWDNWSLADKPMDIWALGCIGYQLITGSPPFGAGAPAVGAVMRAAAAGSVQLQRPTWFGTHASSGPLEHELLQLIYNCLAIDPSSRPTAERVVEAASLMCYPEGSRKYGTVQSVGSPFASCNWISDSDGNSLFFHSAEFYGSVAPQQGQHVSFCFYPGSPSDRAAPVLLLKARNP